MKASDLERMVIRAGWIQYRQTGSHRLFRHPVYKGLLSIPFHGSKEVPKGTASSILKKAGIKKDK
jgi:predicted RNA binding protein YcfA (HicA-like mRNA interferase family)